MLPVNSHTRPTYGPTRALPLALAKHRAARLPVPNPARFARTHGESVVTLRAGVWPSVAANV